MKRPSQFGERTRSKEKQAGSIGRGRRGTDPSVLARPFGIHHRRSISSCRLPLDMRVAPMNVWSVQRISSLRIFRDVFGKPLWGTYIWGISTLDCPRTPGEAGNALRERTQTYVNFVAPIGRLSELVGRFLSLDMRKAIDVPTQNIPTYACVYVSSTTCPALGKLRRPEPLGLSRRQCSEPHFGVRHPAPKGEAHRSVAEPSI